MGGLATMKKALATLSSGLILSIGLTVPAWAQLVRGTVGPVSRGGGDLGAGPSEISNSTLSRTHTGIGDDQPGTMQTHSQTTNAAQAQLSGKKKTKLKAHENSSASANASVNAKHQKRHEKASLTAKSNTQAKMESSASTKNVEANSNVSSAGKSSFQTGSKGNISTSTRTEASVGEHARYKFRRESELEHADECNHADEHKGWFEFQRQGRCRRARPDRSPVAPRCTTLQRGSTGGEPQNSPPGTTSGSGRRDS